ncbi:RHS repeat-associated core domain-containing protein [Pseudomonas entomophila]|uniref:RHS repeat-associated core domain-containing protein n=1 Tax=Pseudomonas entomophila TaxID=312306 RepID=UPI0024075B09|nr:RHS repeat-associated core domain-containing protein [Pseudomonas entomophila]MDF9616330.1 RHS repeat-associated core domain-containing protein [Pseudomonas entomophila]
MKNSGHSLHHGTPTVAVRDNRGLAVRQIVYHRHPDTPAGIDERITRHRFDAFGHPVESIDPRLPAPNFTYHLSMAGETLRTDSVDAGRSLALNDIAGRPLMHLGANDVARYHHYESAPLAGRPLRVIEGFTGATPRIAERFAWAGSDQASKDHNLAGLPVRHYDTAGRLETEGVALTGLQLSLTRQLLAVDGEADWQGADEAAWERLLAPETYTTLAHADATGTMLKQTDAGGHKQRLAYDIAGQLANSWLTLKGGTEQAILASVTYSAAGQKLREEHGNGVLTTFTYEPRTQRLLHILAERPTDRKRLQDLRYAYDPVGNVIHLHNDAQASRFYRNQKVDPEHHYTYDTLYQLASATGRELLDIANRPPKQRSTTLPLPSDDGTLVNYVRHYHYDRGGNLTGVNHNADANSYKIELTVSDRSNRAVSKDVTEDPAQVDAYFDAAGNQRQLQAAQLLEWSSRGELARAVLIARDSLAADEETYRYDANSQRVLKRRSDLTSGTVHHSHVLYLPGLELRIEYNHTTVESSRHEIIVGAAGSAQVRVLHWETGLPTGMSNDSIRYSYTDLIGSVGLELDKNAQIISQEEYYPYGEVAVWMPHNAVEAKYKTVRYSGKERDATGLYYYGYRYYQPWLGRWLSPDPAGTVDGLNLYRMVRNNPATLYDTDGLSPTGQPSENKTTEAQLRKRSREEVYHTYAAIEAAPRIINETTEEVANFLQSKTTTVIYSATSMVAVEVVGGTASALTTVVTTPFLGPGAFVAGMAAKETLKALAPPYKPVPDTDMSKALEKETHHLWSKVKAGIKKFANAEFLTHKGIDKAGNTLIDTAAEAAVGTAVPGSVPITSVYKATKKLIEAKNTSKEQVARRFSADLSQVETTLNEYVERVSDSFNRNGRPIQMSMWVDPLGRRRSLDEGLPMEIHVGHRPYLRRSSLDSHVRRTAQAVAKGRHVIAQYDQRKK